MNFTESGAEVFISEFKYFCAIYFLVKENDVVYVGRTNKGLERVFQHQDKEFDKVYILKCRDSEVKELEKTFIKKYSPLYNIMGNNPKYSFARIAKEFEVSYNRFKEFARNILGVPVTRGFMMPCFTKEQASSMVDKYLEYEKERILRFGDYKLSEEHRKKISDALKGRKLPKKTLEKMSIANKGKKLSEEHKRKIGETNRERSKNRPPISDETREKMSKSQIEAHIKRKNKV